MSNALSRAEKALEIIEGVLQQKVGKSRIGGRTQRLTVEVAVLALLRKRVSEGDAKAFTILVSYERRCPAAQAAVDQLRQPYDEWAFFARGGVLNVPSELSVQDVCAQLKRGMTTSERRHLFELLRKDARKRIQTQPPLPPMA